ncbi:MAG TPA: AmmeMemoRadiSam system protein A [Rectinema sp.]|nr:AmmeMemoRadiSam system protein A [Rectinema sp.]HOI98821.1 AmmeMemoRadiSam system protein A [Rectinema sp.]
MEFAISPEDQKKLLNYARLTIHASLKGEKEIDPPHLSTSLKCGAFVTVKKNGSLRGCIGRIQGDANLPSTIKQMALAAAFEDPRFPPLHEEELPLIEIEITLLSPLYPISPEEIVIGKHGLLIYANGRSGILLPQVPIEFGWDKETFLEQLCWKAGLPSNIWKSPLARLYGFEGFVFSESELKEASSSDTCP